MATYIPGQYLEALEKALEASGLSRYAYLRALVYRDLVRKGFLEESKALGNDRHVTEGW
jgi:hypothetical protein